jgi:hypothetical protein
MFSKQSDLPVPALIAIPCNYITYELSHKLLMTYIGKILIFLAGKTVNNINRKIAHKI